MSSANNRRPNMGEHIFNFLKDYTVIDIETTGLDPGIDNIIELSAIRVRDYGIADRFTTLVQPPLQFFTLSDGTEFSYYVSNFISDLTGITNDMLVNAPIIEDVFKQYTEFVGSDVVVGHNILFDLKFIYDNMWRFCNRAFSNNYVDTMRLSRKVFKNLKRHRLSDLAAVCGVSYDGAHRSLVDCEITNACYGFMRCKVGSDVSSLDEFLMLAKRGYNKIDCSSIKPQSNEIDAENPIFGKTFVFTGALSSFSRAEAMQQVVNRGGLISNSITKKTDYLVVGSFEYISSVHGDKSSKLITAEKYKLAGSDIDIISENIFADMMNL